MKLRNIILTLFALALLASCNKEEEVYEKRDVKVESVFDNIEGKEEEKPAEEAKEEKKEEPKKEEAEKPADNQEANQNPQNNQNPANKQNPADNNQANKQTKTANVLANLREGPTAFEENFILSVPAGSQVEFVEEIYQDGVAWSKVRFNGREGFIRSDLLR